MESALAVVCAYGQTPREFLDRLWPGTQAPATLDDYQGILTWATTCGHLVTHPPSFVPLYEPPPAKERPVRHAGGAPIFVRVNPTDLDGASIFSVPVTLNTLLKSALYGAALMGHYDAVHGCVCNAADQSDQQCVRQMLRLMMSHGIPLFVATGRDQQDVVESKFDNAAKRFRAGSPLLLCDNKSSLICLAAPMGELGLVKEGVPGLLPEALRSTVRSKTSVEMFVRVLCVAPYPTFAATRWFRNGDPKFRWDLYKGHANPTAFIPVNSVMADLFGKYGNLRKLRECLGDFCAKLAALQDVPRGKPPALPAGKPATRGKKREQWEAKARQYERRLKEDAIMWTEWRRALLLRRLMEHDDLGVANHVLSGVLPENMMWAGAPRLANPAPVEISALWQVGQDVVHAIQALVCAVNPTDAAVDRTVGRRGSDRLRDN